jgi:hypothetical protein
MKRDQHHFGPWTTALHHGSRLELSAFWRLRLGRLGSLATSRARTSWGATFALCITAGALIVAPRVELHASGQADELPTASASASAKPQAAGNQPSHNAAVTAKPHHGEPFTATFSNGVKVQLVGLSENPSKRNVWWAPDGSRLDAAPYARVPAIMHPGEGRLAREICFRWINTPDDPDFETGWEIDPPQGGSGGGIAFDANGEQLKGLTAWAVMPRSQDTCTLRFSVSIRATSWLTVFTNRGTNFSSMGGTIDGVLQGAIFGEPYAKDGGTSITVSHQIPGKAVRLLAVDRDGLPDIAVSKGGAGVLGFSQSTYHLANLSLDRIQRFELQSQKREFETIEFRNVSLHPKLRTEVQIVRVPSEKKAQPSNTGAAASVSRARIVSH